MGYVPTYYQASKDWLDDVIDYLIDDPTTIVGPAAGDRYIIASAGNEALSGILHEVIMDAGGYVNCVPGDIGLPVVDTGVGVGVLVAYNNVTRTWIVSSVTGFAVPDNITITLGTGAGTSNSDLICGYQTAADLTALVAAGDIIRIRGGANERGWFECDTIAFDGANTNLVTVENPTSNVIAATACHYATIATDWAVIGVDRLSVYDGAAFIRDDAPAPTNGTTVLCQEAAGVAFNQFLTFSGNVWGLFAATVDHTALDNLLVGDSGHTQFLLLDGRAAGQSAYGGTAAGDDLILKSTSNAAKGYVEIQEALAVFLTSTIPIYFGAVTRSIVDDGANVRAANSTGYTRFITRDGIDPSFSITNAAETLGYFCIDSATPEIHMGCVAGVNRWGMGVDTLSNTTGGSNNFLRHCVYSTTDAHAPQMRFVKSDSNTIGTDAATADTEICGLIDFRGISSAPAEAVVASITARQQGATAAILGGQLVLETSERTVGVNTGQLTLDQDGSVQINNGTTAQYVDMVNGTQVMELLTTFANPGTDRAVLQLSPSGSQTGGGSLYGVRVDPTLILNNAGCGFDGFYAVMTGATYTSFNNAYAFRAVLPGAYPAGTGMAGMHMEGDGRTVELLNNTYAGSFTGDVLLSSTSLLVLGAAARSISDDGNDINIATGRNLDITLGDAAGADYFRIYDSAPALIFSIDSNGNETVYGSLLPAATSAQQIGGTLNIWADLYLEMGRFYDTTGAEAGHLYRSLTEFILAPSGTGGDANMVVLLGDNAGATHFTVQDSGTNAMFDVDSNGNVDIQGKLTVAGAIDPTCLICAEQASIPIAAVGGTGTFWVKNDTPSTPYFTDDTGDDFLLATTTDLASYLPLSGGGTLSGGDLNLNDDGSAVSLTVQTSQGDANLILRTYSATLAERGDLTFIKSHSNTFGTAARTLDGENLGKIEFYGYEATPTVSCGATINVFQNGATNTYVPADMIFETWSDTAKNVNQFIIHHNGSLSTFEDAPDVSKGGLCLNQEDADTFIMTAKNSDVTHPFTTQAEADTFFAVGTNSPSNGGVGMRSYVASSSTSFRLNAYQETGGTTPCIMMSAYKSDGGTSTASMAATDYMFSVANAGTNRFVVEGNGDCRNSTDSWVILDIEDDIALLSALNEHFDPSMPDHNDTRTVKGKHVKRAKELRIFDETEDGARLMSQTKMQALEAGCIVQMWKAVKAIAAELGMDEARLKAIAQSVEEA